MERAVQGVTQKSQYFLPVCRRFIKFSANRRSALRFQAESTKPTMKAPLLGIQKS